MTMQIIDDGLASHTIAGWSDGWRPIHTAPKDQDILAWGAGVGHLVVQFDAECGSSQAGEYPWLTLDGPNYHKSAFELWMPLPAAPQPK